MASRLNIFIDLSAAVALKRGELREIYPHPAFDDMLIKVMRGDRLGPGGNIVAWKRKHLALGGGLRLPFTYDGNRKFGLYFPFYREIREMLRAARMVYPQVDFLFPFALVHGLTWTSRGLGLVVERISGEDGGLAPTVRELLGRGMFGPEHQAKLDAFFDTAIRHHFVFGDLNISNIVLAAGPNGGRMVCIDGIGEKALLPVHEWSAWANRRKLERLRRRLAAAIAKRLPRA